MRLREPRRAWGPQQVANRLEANLPRPLPKLPLLTHAPLEEEPKSYVPASKKRERNRWEHNENTLVSGLG